MSSRIAILADSVADQIAAGEVVERPASVVKELIENALDAGASKIVVEVESGGRSLIRVSDDGSGMVRADAVMCIERHATSKITDVSDLIGVGSYGFRGEALPAIASIAKFELETAADGDDEGTRLVVNGGRVDSVEPVARQTGTTVVVKRLFYNTPARRKFLRSKAAESRAVVEAVNAVALARPSVAFKLVMDERGVVDIPASRSMEERIDSLLGPDVAGGLIAVQYAEGEVKISGHIQRPAEARPSGRKAYLFVNGRPFRDSFLVRAAEAGYRGAVAPGDRPSLFLALEVPGDQIDVNVHPSKLEVRFRDRFLVERCFEEAIRNAINPIQSATAITTGTGGEGWRDAWQGSGTPGGGEEQFASLFDESESQPRPDLGPFMQVFNSFIVCESTDGIAFIDQHSAHERIIYERAMDNLERGGVASQNLLLPITIDLAAEELAVIEEYNDLLSRIGFEVEPFGGHSVVIHATPNPHPRFDGKRCFEELVADLGRVRFGGLHNRLERFAATYGCRAAIKAGEKLEMAEIRSLVSQLFMCELPPHDVHGRPTIVRLPRPELERRFGRS